MEGNSKTIFHVTCFWRMSKCVDLPYQGTFVCSLNSAKSADCRPSSSDGQAPQDPDLKLNYRFTHCDESGRFGHRRESKNNESTDHSAGCSSLYCINLPEERRGEERCGEARRGEAR